MLIGLDKAVPLLSTLGLVLSMFLISRSWRNLVGKEYFFIALHVGAGVPVGLLISDFLPKKILIAILVFFTFFVGIRGLMQLMRQNAESMKIKPAKKNFLSRIILFIGGIFQGAFSSGGPIVVMYATKALPEKSKFRATLPALWLTTNTIMEIKWIISGNVWNMQLARQFFLILPFIACGMVLGDYLHHKVNQKKFTFFVYSLLIVVGIILGSVNFL